MTADESSIPVPPPAAVRAFGAALPLAEHYARLLVGPGIERGLLGPREAVRVWDRHLVNCALLSPHVPEGSRVVDIGSGAGLPGVVLALMRPDLHVTLVEPLLRRSTYLGEVVEELRLERVDVVRARAEDLPAPHAADVVTARAVAHLATLVRLATPLLAPRGTLLALKGSQASAELAEPDTVRAMRGVAPQPATITELGEGEDRTWLVSVDLVSPVRRPSPRTAARSAKRAGRGRAGTGA